MKYVRLDVNVCMKYFLRFMVTSNSILTVTAAVPFQLLCVSACKCVCVRVYIYIYIYVGPRVGLPTYTRKVLFMLKPSAVTDAEFQIHTCEQTIGHLQLSLRVL